MGGQKVTWSVCLLLIGCPTTTWGHSGGLRQLDQVLAKGPPADLQG